MSQTTSIILNPFPTYGSYKHLKHKTPDISWPYHLYSMKSNTIWSGLEVSSTAITQRLHGKAGLDDNWTNNVKMYLNY